MARKKVCLHLAAVWRADMGSLSWGPVKRRSRGTGRSQAQHGEARKRLELPVQRVAWPPVRRHGERSRSQLHFK